MVTLLLRPVVVVSSVIPRSSYVAMVIDDLVVECVRQLGSTAVAITHDIASARRIGDAAAMIHRGMVMRPDMTA